MEKDKQLVAITSLNVPAKASLISLITNNGGGNREACLCKFPRTVISYMLDSQNRGGVLVFKNIFCSFDFVMFFFPQPLQVLPGRVNQDTPEKVLIPIAVEPSMSDHK